MFSMTIFALHYLRFFERSSHVLVLQHLFAGQKWEPHSCKQILASKIGSPMHSYWDASGCNKVITSRCNVHILRYISYIVHCTCFTIYYVFHCVAVGMKQWSPRAAFFLSVSNTRSQKLCALCYVQSKQVLHWIQKRWCHVHDLSWSSVKCNENSSDGHSHL